MARCSRRLFSCIFPRSYEVSVRLSLNSVYYNIHCELIIAFFISLLLFSGGTKIDYVLAIDVYVRFRLYNVNNHVYAPVL